jgi:hypothetical protein
MAEMVGLSRGFQRRNGGVGGLFAALRLVLSRLTRGRRATRLRVEAWPDYLLRDIGVERASLDRADPRAADWLRR